MRQHVDARVYLWHVLSFRCSRRQAVVRGDRWSSCRLCSRWLPPGGDRGVGRCQTECWRRWLQLSCSPAVDHVGAALLQRRPESPKHLPAVDHVGAALQPLQRKTCSRLRRLPRAVVVRVAHRWFRWKLRLKCSRQRVAHAEHHQ
jgi:hypothetical protein